MSQTKRIGLVVVPVIIGVVGWLWYQNREEAESVQQTPPAPVVEATVAGGDVVEPPETTSVVEVVTPPAPEAVEVAEQPPAAEAIVDTVVEVIKQAETATDTLEVPEVAAIADVIAEPVTVDETSQSTDIPPVAQDAPAIEPVAVLPVVEEAVEPVEATEADPMEQAAAEPQQSARPAPEFDLVRVETDGATVIAGRAEPGAEVTITVDGQAVGTATASARGEFVAMVDTPQTGAAQEIRLQTGSVEQGNESTSEEAVIVIVDTPSEDETQAEAPVVVLSTPATVEVIQPAIEQIAGQIVLDSISYSAEGDVVLSGRGQPGSAARIYANGAPITQADIRQDGNWSVVVNTINVGDYTLRVDEVDTEGEVTSRAESPFRRVNPDVAIATLAETGPLQQIVVQPGNNLWTIARERYGRGPLFTQIFTANSDQIRDPDLIYPGQIFSLPDD
ncbi:hypothetical protein SAMN06273572_102168 [Monaibacterium marinum]|uniref:LysM domain-containing protein n=1 Tax=Pontivivens marinum TaxID=1690039 RepID=A0A2C9CQF5_9RHOB|nr:Ig-like domain-containing protein [Monaibacterium marinum]SOH93492.1 hypothetical protein SAMN06273572_102168 [Monaibacterium marinum]